jgi:hypothetical protein
MFGGHGLYVDDLFVALIALGRSAKPPGKSACLGVIEQRRFEP